ncbi:hypothetical protein DSO57_1013848 [Entomophthora muscae]|uniref:Uncharacterized protein n=1 Tax=Entomophthora muscae TaxID=34485 RepID=A0ACC2T5L2_9FUNG|nr:hypothetical protein DSO57_1013848 [Entomophthora muscae]
MGAECWEAALDDSGLIGLVRGWRLHRRSEVWMVDFKLARLGTWMASTEWMDVIGCDNV